MTLAAFVIFMAEYFLMKKLFAKYSREGEDLDVIEFVARASLEDIIKLRHHINNTWLAMGLITIGSIVKL